jgi:hypothetical protein
LWLCGYVHVLYLGGVVVPWGYLAAAAAMAAPAALSVAVFLHPPHLLYAEVLESSAVGNLTFYTVSVVRAVPGGGPPGGGVVVLMTDGKVYMPFLWETAAFLALEVGCTAAAASLVAFWRALGSSAEGVRRALEFYERARRLLT